MWSLHVTSTCVGKLFRGKGSLHCFFGVQQNKELWNTINAVWNSINDLWNSINDLWNSINVHDLWNSINDLWNSINDLWNSIIKHIYGIP